MNRAPNPLPARAQRKDAGGGRAAQRAPVAGAGFQNPPFPPYTLFSSLPGVHAATVALLAEAADVAYDASALTPPDLVAAVGGAGFSATVESVVRSADTTAEVVTLAVDGLSCASCSAAVERVLGELRGVTRASASAVSARGVRWGVERGQPLLRR